MTNAYLYVRVSTDEQKRKGYSLPEQEDHLLKYCEYNGIDVIGIYREDFSAKNFNRPEWKKLLATIKKNSKKTKSNILFVKWDRFSRNIEYAYEMIGILRNFNVSAMAIDQPIDFSVPESTVMLAVYLSIPEAENTRRGMNTSNGLRRAKMLGRYPNKAPLGYLNCTSVDGRKQIIPVQPAADIIKWAFRQLAKHSFKIEEVRRMVCAKGLNPSRSAFWKLIRNPIYCGLIPLSLKEKPIQLVNGLHEPIISKSLFNEVQAIINTNRRTTCKSTEINDFFFLKGFLECPICRRKLRGSFSHGSTKKYPYYHCSKGCRTRVKAEILHESYIIKLNELSLSDRALELFNEILKDINIRTQKIEYLKDRRFLINQLDEQRQLISKARRMFIEDKLKFDDFKELKVEYETICNYVGMEISSNSTKLSLLEKQFKIANKSLKNIFYSYSELDITDKWYINNLITPKICRKNEDLLSIKVNKSLAKILSGKYSMNTFVAINSDDVINNSSDRRVTVKQAIAIMAKSNIKLKEDDSTVILDFLYRMSKTYYPEKTRKS